MAKRPSDRTNLRPAAASKILVRSYVVYLFCHRATIGLLMLRILFYRQGVRSLHGSLHKMGEAKHCMHLLSSQMLMKGFQKCAQIVS